MRFCDHCLAPLSQDATHCPECGLPVTSGTDDPLLHEEAERLVNPRLARANLLRLRGQWEEAIRACAEVLRQFPSNVHAHALMGDIYRDQGNLEEAAQWYKLALELAPDSVVDRQRLEQVQRELELRQQAQHQSQEVQHLQKQTRTLRIFSASVIGAAIVIAIGITWAFQNRIASENAPLNITTSRLAGEPSATTAPLPMPERDGAAAPSPTLSEPVPPVGSAESKAKTESVWRSEDDLLAEKVREWLRPHNMQPDVLTVTTDPLANHLLVTFGYTSEVPKDVQHRTAWLAAAAVFALQPSVEVVRVRCLVPMHSPSAEKMLVLGFSVDLQRKTMPPHPTETPVQDIPAFFQNVYYNPAAGVTPGR